MSDDLSTLNWNLHEHRGYKRKTFRIRLNKPQEFDRIQAFCYLSTKGYEVLDVKGVDSIEYLPGKHRLVFEAYVKQMSPVRH